MSRSIIFADVPNSLPPKGTAWKQRNARVRIVLPLNRVRAADGSMVQAAPVTVFNACRRGGAQLAKVAPPACFS